MNHNGASCLAILAALVVACGDGDGDGGVRKPPADPTLAIGSTTTAEPTSGPSTSDTGGSAQGQPCSIDAPCPTTGFCVAPNTGGTAVGPAGEFTCGSACVVADDPSRWCLDETSCCDESASCVGGLCRLVEGTEGPVTDTGVATSGTDTGTTGTTDTGTTGTTDTGATDTGTTGSGTG